MQSILYLQDFPRLGRPGIVPDTRELGILGLPYKAVYRIEGDTIVIVAIVHQYRLYP
jgi:plasmid stabilization system protein ParE